MNEQNIVKIITPLLNPNWDKTKKQILNNLKEILLDSIYFRSLSRISPTYSESIINNLITTFEYKKYKKDVILLNYNEEITNYSFIFKGKLNIYKINMEKALKNLELISNENDDFEKDEILQYFQNYIKKSLKAVNIENIFINNFKSSSDDLKEVKNKRAYDLEPLFDNIINNSKELDYSLTEGRIFGEEYLYNNMIYSHCILECGSDCILGELNRQIYNKIYKRFNKVERAFITVFLINLKLFSSSNYFFSKLQQCLIKRYYTKNEIVFNQNDRFHAFYLIRSGKINLSLKIPKTVNCNLETNLIMGNLLKERFTSNKSYITKGKYSENIEYNLISLQSGEFIGEIEYYEKNDKYKYTALCTEDCVLFEFDIDLFEHIITNNYKINQNLKGFYQKIKEKMKILQERIYSIRMNNSAIKKSDYILSKNKFTKNILQGHPLKEEKKNNNNLRYNKVTNTKSSKKIDKIENFYFKMISPFLKRYSSVSKSKKLNKIKINNNFFNNLNLNEKLLSPTINYKLKETNSRSQNSLAKINISNRLLTEANDSDSNYFNMNRYLNLIFDGSQSNRKDETKIFNKKLFPQLSNNFKDNKKKLKKKLNLDIKSDNEKLYDIMDVNLIFSKNDKINNIPKILKTTKESDMYKQFYEKGRIKKINTYYYQSPKKKQFTNFFQI